MLIEICMGSSCFSRGNGDNLRLIREFAGSHHLATEIKTFGHLCEAECGEGPNIRINGRMYRGVRGENITPLLERTLKGDASR